MVSRRPKRETVTSAPSQGYVFITLVWDSFVDVRRGSGEKNVSHKGKRKESADKHSATSVPPSKRNKLDAAITVTSGSSQRYVFISFVFDSFIDIRRSSGDKSVSQKGKRKESADKQSSATSVPPSKRNKLDEAITVTSGSSQKYVFISVVSDSFIDVRRGSDEKSVRGKGKRKESADQQLSSQRYVFISVGSEGFIDVHRNSGEKSVSSKGKRKESAVQPSSASSVSPSKHSKLDKATSLPAAVDAPTAKGYVLSCFRVVVVWLTLSSSSMCDRR